MVSEIVIAENSFHDQSYFRYADGNITMNRYVNAFNIFCFQLVPAYIIDFLLRCFKQKPL